MSVSGLIIISTKCACKSKITACTPPASFPGMWGGGGGGGGGGCHTHPTHSLVPSNKALYIVPHGCAVTNNV